MESELNQKQRTYIIFIYLIFLIIFSKLITGEFIPKDSGKSLWLFSAIGFYFFTYLSTPYFNPPRDSVANSATSALLLATLDLNSIQVFKYEIDLFRWISFYLSVFTIICGVVALIAHGKERGGNRLINSISSISFRISNYLGKGQISFSPLIIISILGFYQSQITQQIWLLFLWTILVFLRPLEMIVWIFSILKHYYKGENDSSFVGSIIRIDDPGIIRIDLKSPAVWNREILFIAHLPNGKQVETLPLFIQMQEEQLIGTGICGNESNVKVSESNKGQVYTSPKSRSVLEFIKDLCKDDQAADLIGFVIENSDISKIWFEISSEIHLEEGWLIYLIQDNQKIYYQIINAKTKEESFKENPRGTQIVIAEQLGMLNSDKGFKKYYWVPKMNTPVFLPKEIIEFGKEEKIDGISIGNIPHSKISVYSNLEEMHQFHTAILGATGTGKTEFAFDIIRQAVQQGFKIFCVDFTGEYKERLSEFTPLLLGLDSVKASELQEKLFDVEAGEFSASKEKIALKEFIKEITPEVHQQVNDFLENKDNSVGIFEIEEIANTKATLRATELYLSCIFSWARKNRKRRKILLVLEEAHTIIPESNLYRYDRVETDAVVGRMSQIALQGRKYGVGILLISQRTALVSKTLLSQCNTVVCFKMHDETGIKYLGNVFSSDHSEIIPNLKYLHGIAFGKAIRSERPVIFEVPFDEEKEKASKALDMKEVEE